MEPPLDAFNRRIGDCLDPGPLDAFGVVGPIGVLVHVMVGRRVHDDGESHVQGRLVTGVEQVDRDYGVVGREGFAVATSGANQTAVRR